MEQEVLEESRQDRLDSQAIKRIIDGRDTGIPSWHDAVVGFFRCSLTFVPANLSCAQESLLTNSEADGVDDDTSDSDIVSVLLKKRSAKLSSVSCISS